MSLDKKNYGRVVCPWKLGDDSKIRDFSGQVCILFSIFLKKE